MDSGTTNLRVSEEVFDGILERLKKFDKVRNWAIMFIYLFYFLVWYVSPPLFCQECQNNLMELEVNVISYNVT